jgi:hypothetical protein
MKNKLIILGGLLSMTALNARIPSLKPTILAPSWKALWQQHLDQAHELYRQGNLVVAAAEAYKALSENRQHRDEQISALAAQKLEEIVQSDGYIEQKKLEDERHHAESNQLMQKLHEADDLREQGNYAEAAAIYTELADAPLPHHWMMSCGASRLEDMRKAGQI